MDEDVRDLKQNARTVKPKNISEVTGEEIVKQLKEGNIKSLNKNENTGTIEFGKHR